MYAISTSVLLLLNRFVTAYLCLQFKFFILEIGQNYVYNLYESA